MVELEPYLGTLAVRWENTFWTDGQSIATLG